MKTLMAIDGNSILNRAFYGVKPLTTKDGLFTNAVYGTVNIIWQQLQSLKPDYCIAAFDMKAPTFRHAMYDGYKASRKGMPPELAMQLPYAKQVLTAMGITVIEKSGYEADDILGTFADMSGEELFVYVFTGDRDSLQLISDNTTVLLVTTGETIAYNTEKFKEKYGVLPSQYVDVKALMGDSSDNIPGVLGIGEKTAFKLIVNEGSLDSVYDNIENVNVGNSAREKLIAGKESAYMSQKLATICRSVPLEISLSDIDKTKRDDASLTELFTKLEFSVLIKRFGLDGVKKSSDRIYFERLDSFPSIKDSEYAVYTADDGIYLFDGQKGIVVSCDADAGDFFKNNRIISNDVKSLYYKFGEADAVFDTSVAAYVINSSDNDYSVQKLSLRYLSEQITAESDENESGIFNESTAKACDIYILQKVLSSRIENEGVSDLYYETELPLSRVLYDMEKHGFRIDTKGLADYGNDLNRALEGIRDSVYMQAGHEFNINSPKQLAEVLFEELKLPAQKKTKTGYSTNADVLESLRPYHPIISGVLEYRALSKLIGTYVDGMLKVCGEDGIIHTSFNQTVTATGRLSSTEPNLQNIPIRTELGRELRRFFVPTSDKYTLVDADYSQIELRLLAAISGDETMMTAFENGIDIHTMTASQVFNVPVESVTSEMRKRAKAVNFGIVYGIGAFSLARDIGVTVAAAGKYVDSYLHKYPAVSRYLDGIKEVARKNGYVQTLLGRRRYIPELASAKKTEQAFGERVAMNSPIQGTAADIIKIAMVNTARALEKSGMDAHLILQVHDELIIETDKSCVNEVRKLLKYEMENAVRLPVKLSVEVSDGDTWYECK